MNFLNELIRDEIKENVPEKRPPNTWNDPKITQKDHSLRFSVNIFEDYKDPDVHEFFYFIEKMGDEIKTFNKDNWNTLVEKVFKVF